MTSDQWWYCRVYNVALKSHLKLLNLRMAVIRYELHKNRCHLASLTSRLMWCLEAAYLYVCKHKVEDFQWITAVSHTKHHVTWESVLISRHLGLRLKGLVFSLNLCLWCIFGQVFPFHLLYCKEQLGHSSHSLSFFPWNKVTRVKATLVKVWRRLSPSCAWCQRCGGTGTAPSRSWRDTLWARGSTSSPDPAGSRCTAAERSSSPRSSWKQKESRHFLHLSVHILAWVLHSFRDVSMHFSLGCFGDFYFGSVWAYKHVRQSFEAQKFHCEVCHFFPPGSDPGVEC